jgi:DNA-binding NarL/FixJ family response regulator
VTSSPHTLAIVEDDSALLDSFREAISVSREWAIVGAYTRAETAYHALHGNPPDVVLVDIQLPGMSGIEFVRKLKPECPRTQYLMVTVYEDADRVFEALAAGASGYVLKRDAPEQLLKALDDVFRGGSPMSSVIARKVVQHFQTPPRVPSEEYNLTPREKETLDLLAKGCLYKEIAHELGIKLETVRFHLFNIYGKLHVRTRTEAVVRYLGRTL